MQYIHIEIILPRYHINAIRQTFINILLFIKYNNVKHRNDIKEISLFFSLPPSRDNKCTSRESVNSIFHNKIIKLSINQQISHRPFYKFDLSMKNFERLLKSTSMLHTSQIVYWFLPRYTKFFLLGNNSQTNKFFGR